MSPCPESESAMTIRSHVRRIPPAATTRSNSYGRTRTAEHEEGPRNVGFRLSGPDVSFIKNPRDGARVDPQPTCAGAVRVDENWKASVSTVPRTLRSATGLPVSSALAYAWSRTRWFPRGRPTNAGPHGADEHLDAWDAIYAQIVRRLADVSASTRYMVVRG